MKLIKAIKNHLWACISSHDSMDVRVGFGTNQARFFFKKNPLEPYVLHRRYDDLGDELCQARLAVPMGISCFNFCNKRRHHDGGVHEASLPPWRVEVDSDIASVV